MKRFRSGLGLSAGIAALLLALAAVAVFTLNDKPQSSGQAQVGTPPPSSQAQVSVATSPGERVYTKWCGECHATPIGPATKVLEQRYKGQIPAILQERPGIPAELVKVTVRHGVGFMPPFRKTEISDSELDLLATYLSSVKASANKKE